jgi:hypothetical protein
MNVLYFQSSVTGSSRKVKELVCPNTGSRNKVLIDILSALRENNQSRMFTAIEFDGLQLTDGFLNLLAAAIAQNTHLRELYIH